ncbi:MAG TPA: hypothetical protein VGC66_07205 [Pyrinomonadaceae bacterium]|jgi:hypothetical protein
MTTRILIVLLLLLLPHLAAPEGKKQGGNNSPGFRANTQQDNNDCQKELKNLRTQYSILEDRIGTLDGKYRSCIEERDAYKAGRDKYQRDFNACVINLTAETQSNQELKSSNQRLLKIAEDLQKKLEEGGQSAAETSQQLDSLRASIRKEPEKILAADNLALKDANQNQATLRRFEENGQVHEIRELLIGTLEIVSVRNEVTVPSETELKVIFKPHRLLVNPGSNKAVSWYLELQVKTDKIQFDYDKRSNGELKRLVGDKPEEWIWKFKPTSSFKLDKPHIYGFASFEGENEKGGPVEIENREVEIVEHYVPGTLAAMWNFIKNNFTFILGALTAILAAATAYFGLKKQQLDYRLSELKLKLEEITGEKPKAAEQTLKEGKTG